MPFTSVSPVRAMKGYLTYALVNTMGELRGVGFESTLGGSVAEITANTRALLASGPKRRKREGYAVLISFDPKEFNPHDAGDVQRAKEHVLETLDRFAHNVPYVVIFHNDRGHLHAHVFLANHDLKTAKSFQGGVHRKLAKASDEVASEMGISVIQKTGGKRDPHKVRAEREGESFPSDDELVARPIAELDRKTWKAALKAQVDALIRHPEVDSFEALEFFAQRQSISVRTKGSDNEVAAGTAGVSFAFVNGGDVVTLAPSGRSKRATKMRSTGRKLGGERYKNVAGINALIAEAHAPKQHTPKSQVDYSPRSIFDRKPSGKSVYERVQQQQRGSAQNEVLERLRRSRQRGFGDD